MCTMEWKEVEPEQKDWEKQIDIVAYYGSVTVASIVYWRKIGWMSVIDYRTDFLGAESLEDAKRKMIDVLDTYFADEIDYYKELQKSLNELNKI